MADPAEAPKIHATKEIGSYGSGNRRELEFPGYIAGGLTGRALGVSYKMSDLFNGIVRRELRSLKDRCPADTCEAGVDACRDDGGNVSAATYYCTRAESCGALCLQAAANVVGQAETVTATIMETVETQFEKPQTVVVEVIPAREPVQA